MDKQPNDLVLMMLEFVPLVNLCTSKSVSRRFNQLGEWVIWRMRELWWPADTRALAYFGKRCKRLRAIRGVAALSDAHMPLLCNNARTLQRVDLELTPGVYHVLHIQFPELKAGISTPARLTPWRVWWAYVFPNIEDVTITIQACPGGSDFEALPLTLKKLTLKIRYAFFFALENAFCLDDYKALRSLTLHGTLSFSDSLTTTTAAHDTRSRTRALLANLRGTHLETLVVYGVPVTIVAWVTGAIVLEELRCALTLPPLLEKQPDCLDTRVRWMDLQSSFLQFRPKIASGPCVPNQFCVLSVESGVIVMKTPG